MTRAAARAALLLALLSVPAWAQSAHANFYEITRPPGVDPSATVYPAAVNRNGQVLVNAALSGHMRAFVWDHGSWTQLQSRTDTSDFSFESAGDLNDFGTIVGQAAGTVPVKWANAASPPERLPPLDPNWPSGGANMIDPAGDIAGSSDHEEGFGGDPFPQAAAVLWPNAGGIQQIRRGDNGEGTNTAGLVLTGDGVLYHPDGSTESVGTCLQHAGNHSLGELGWVVGSDDGQFSGQAGPRVLRNGTCDPLPAPDSDVGYHPTAIADGTAIVGNSTRGAVLWPGDGSLEYLNETRNPGDGWTLDSTIDIGNDGQILGKGHKEGEPANSRVWLIEQPRRELDVTLQSAEVPGTDLLNVKVTVANPGDEPVTDLAPKNGGGLAIVPDVFPPAQTGKLALFRDGGEAFPATLEPGASASHTFQFLSLATGKLLLQAEVKGKVGNEDLRDAEYEEVSIDALPAGRLQEMGAIEAFTTNAYDSLLDASRAWAKKKVKQMQALPKDVRKAWLGSADKLKVRRLDDAMGHMHGISAEELATEVPRGDVIKKGGDEKIADAKRAVRNADGRRERTQAEAKLDKVVANQTLTSSESMALYNRARMQSDNEELWKIYDDYGEQPAKSLWKEGGANLRYLLQMGSYEGRQQIEADLVRFAEENDKTFTKGAWIWNHPTLAYNDAMTGFTQNVAGAEVRRAKREQFKRDLYATNPEKAIELDAQDDSRYLGDVMRSFIEYLTPDAGDALSWANKVATKNVSRASIATARAIAEGDKLAGKPILQGVEDLGDGVRHADDFLFPSADPGELLQLDQLGRKGGAGMREQRLAEQINREVSAQLHEEFPTVDFDFGMAYRPKKSYDPIGSLPKPQAFQEKILDPRSVELLGAPAEALGEMVMFRPEHPSAFPGWKQLPAVQRKADLEVYEAQLDQWVNFNRKHSTGKTAEWKKAIGERRKIEFGGGHTVELELEKVKLGDDAVAIRATYMSIDGTLIHKGKPLPIGSDWDPAMALNVRANKKIAGEMEHRALELWNQKAVKAQKDFGFRSGGHGATAHGLDVTPEQWTKFAKYAAIHLTEAEQPVFEALVVARAGLPKGTKILPAGLPANEHVIITTISDTYVGPLGQVFD